jgi:uncharacterized membrane protein YgdD (TMEM256/DUF423 family)
MNKRIIITASLLGILAVVLGAFGAHGLEGKVQADALKTWETAVDYHFYHVLALLFLSTFCRFKCRLINISYWSFTLGILLFSGSLYLLAAKDVLNITQTSFIGPVTPIGGLCFIIGWTTLLLATIRNK